MNRRHFLATAAAAPLAAAAPVRIAMAGLDHDHARGFLDRMKGRADFDLVGVSEPNAALRERYAQKYAIPPDRLFSSLEAMLDRARPQGVMGFSSTFDHLALIETCARRRIPVTVEKPLAVSIEHGRAIEKAARASGIAVLVNYETTWYRSNLAAWKLVKEGQIGPVRKVVIQDGHQGPREIGVSNEFFAWLTDPVKNGAGALYDFGCYGANLMTWLMDNQPPLSVLAITQRVKPEIYPKVDDEATILLEYAQAQAIIQASWNWPFSRKDMEVYGKTGYVHCVGGNDIKVRLAGGKEHLLPAPEIPAPQQDIVAYLGAVIRGEMKPDGLSSLENNLVVTRILAAAKESAATDRRVKLG